MSGLPRLEIRRLLRSMKRRWQYGVAVAVFLVGLALVAVQFLQIRYCRNVFPNQVESLWLSTVAATGILLLTTVLVVYLFRLADNYSKTQRFTVQLSRTNRRLHKELAHHKQLKESLHNNEIKYKTLYNTSSDAIMLLSEALDYVGCNHACCLLFGYANESEFIGSSPPTLSPEYQPDGVLSSVKAKQMATIALQNGSHTFEWKNRRINGTEFLSTVSLVRLEIEGECVLQATVRDITEQRWTEKMLKASEHHYRLLAENISGVIWSIDLAGHYDYVSPTVLQLQGYSPEELFSQNIAKTLPLEAVPLVRENIENIITEAKNGRRIKPKNLELELCRKDGSKFWAEMTFAGMYDDKSDLVAIQGTTRDITERKETQKALQASEQQLANIVDFLPDAMFAI